MRIKFTKYPLIIKKLLWIYILGFGIGTITHIIDLINHGTILNESVPLWKNYYWVSLTFFDLLAIVLILRSIEFALVISNLIIISDVLINTNGFTLNPFDFSDGYKIILQLIFCIYIVITTPVILKPSTKAARK